MTEEERWVLEQVKSQVRSIMDAEGITNAELARRMGVSRNGVSRFFREEENFTLRRVTRILEAMGYGFLKDPLNIFRLR